MSPFLTKLKSKFAHSQTPEVVRTSLCLIDKEVKDGVLPVSLGKVQQRTAVATRIGERTIRKNQTR
jgi:hypothetical protein